MGLALGLSAALLWGLADYSAAMASREIGAPRVVLGFHLVAVAVMGVAVLVSGELAQVELGELWPFVGIGALGALSYLTFYGALEIGPISIVSPIVSGYAAITVVLALLLLDETLSVGETIAMLVVFGGVLLASADLAPGRAEHVSVRGLLLALVAMVAIGGFVFGVAYYAAEFGWLVPIFLARSFTTLILLAALARDRRPLGRPSARLAGAIVLLAALDTGGYIAFNVGVEHADTAVVAAAAAPYAVVPIVMGVLVLQERPGMLQRVGIVATLAGVALLGLLTS